MANFILRKFDDRTWQRVKSRAEREGRTIKAVVSMLLVRYADGHVSLNVDVDPPAPRARRP